MNFSHYSFYSDFTASVIDSRPIGRQTNLFPPLFPSVGDFPHFLVFLKTVLFDLALPH